MDLLHFQNKRLIYKESLSYGLEMWNILSEGVKETSPFINNRRSFLIVKIVTKIYSTLHTIFPRLCYIWVEFRLEIQSGDAGRGDSAPAPPLVFTL